MEQYEADYGSTKWIMGNLLKRWPLHGVLESRHRVPLEQPIAAALAVLGLLS